MTGIAANQCCLALRTNPDALCGDPAYALVIAGCVHEHIIRNHLCLFHLATHLNAMVCRPCWLSTESHQCPVQVHEVTR